MFSAQNKLSIKKIATSSLGVAFLLFSTGSVLAADTTVGEFLYTDSSLPDTTATCVLNVKNPDGTALLSSEALTSTTDGWYGHVFTSPTTVGYYRSEICCDTTDTQHLCIDKSFTIDPQVSTTGSNASADDIAAAVWGYSGRTLTSFNTLVSDIWNYTSSTLTLTKGSPSSDLADIKKKTSETRLLMEQLVNKPIIENSLIDVKDLDLSERIKESKSIASQLTMNLLILGSTVSKTNTNWSKLTDRQILDNLTEAKNMIGEESDSSSSDSFFGRINFLRDTWGIKESDDLHEEMKAIKDSLGFVITGVSSYGKSTATQKEISAASSYISSSEKVLSLLSKKINDTESISELLDTNLAKVDSILKSWNTKSYLDVKNDVDTLSKDVVAINKVPQGNLMLVPSYSDITGEKKIKNQVLGLQALLYANKKLLIGGNQKTALLANWLEEGSVVIKTLITNPSLLISQTVPLKYYLPIEVKKENILDADAGTIVSYDTEKGEFYVEGNFTLKPGETKTIKVRVEDVWQISGAEIDSLLNQSAELLKPLEKTSFYAQGITLKSDIEVSLNKAKELAKDDITPEAKIKNYREAQLEIISAKEKIEKLKDMVSQASQSGSILGFVGGSQAIGVWGIVIAIVSAFVFMAIYMKKLLGKESKKAVIVAHKPNNFDKFAVFLVVATISGLVSSIGVKKIIIPQVVQAKQETHVLGAATLNYKQLKVVDLVSPDGVVKVYSDEGSEAVAEIVDSGKNAVLVEKSEKRARVVYEGKEVWVLNENIKAN